MASVQMNMRIESDLKRRGSEAFAAAGFSPSEVIRAVWDFAARRRQNPRLIQEFMAELSDDENLVRALRLEAASRGASIVEDAQVRCGVVSDTGQHAGCVDYDALRYQAYLEKARERGIV